MSGKIIFKLFISGMSVKSITAIENFTMMAERYLKGRFDLEIIDLSLNREKASEYQIIALPTLLKLLPKPKRIFLGDLSDTSKIIKLLELA